MRGPKFQLYALDSVVLDAYLREWILRTYPGGSLPTATEFSASLDRAPLDEHMRRIALFGYGRWAMLERDGEPYLLAGMAACKYDEHHPGFFTLEYSAAGHLVAAGYWKRDDPGEWLSCEGADLPRTFKQQA